MESRNKFTMCRLCLCESECFIDIFQVSGWLGYVAAEIITDLLQFHVSETDGYPHVICSICQGKLISFMQFKKKCQNSRDTYDNMFADNENHPEHPIDIEPSVFIKTEIEEGTNYVDTAAEEDIDPAYSEEEEIITDDIHPQVELRTVKLEPKDPLDIQEEEQEVELRPVKLEPEEHFITQNTQQEVSNCSIAFTSMEYSAHQRKRTLSETSHGPKEYTNKSVDASTCDNTKSSCSSGVKVKKMDNKVDQERPYVCKICHQRFKQFCGLKNHRSIHSGIKPYGCDVCGKNFRLKHTLQCHSRTHSGEKPYTCEICGRSFAQQGVLINHRRVHTIVKPYKCEICVKYFDDMRGLTNHRNYHSRENPLACEICGVQFAHRDEVNAHVLVHS